MCSVHQAQQWDLPDSYLNATLSLEHNRQTCLVHEQINRDCASRATTTLTDQLHQACSTNTGEKQQRRRDASATNNLVNVGTQTNLITLPDLCVSSQHSPNTVTRLSHNSIGHGVVGVNMVVTGCSSQHPASKTAVVR